MKKVPPQKSKKPLIFSRLNIEDLAIKTTIKRDIKEVFFNNDYSKWKEVDDVFFELLNVGYIEKLYTVDNKLPPIIYIIKKQWHSLTELQALTTTKVGSKGA